MGRFEFDADDEGEDYWLGVVEGMCELFGVSEAEAIARVNRAFGEWSFFGYSILYHEMQDHWAKELMYKTDFWWLDEANAEISPPPDGFGSED